MAEALTLQAPASPAEADALPPSLPPDASPFPVSPSAAVSVPEFPSVAALLASDTEEPQLPSMSRAHSPTINEHFLISTLTHSVRVVARRQVVRCASR